MVDFDLLVAIFALGAVASMALIFRGQEMRASRRENSVFVASRLDEFKAERAIAAGIARSTGWSPVLVEGRTGAIDDIIELCESSVSKTDLVVVMRSRHDGRITSREIEVARRRKMPIVIYWFGTTETMLGLVDGEPHHDAMGEFAEAARSAPIVNRDLWVMQVPRAAEGSKWLSDRAALREVLASDLSILRKRMTCLASRGRSKQQALSQAVGADLGSPWGDQSNCRVCAMPTRVEEWRPVLGEPFRYPRCDECIGWHAKQRENVRER